MLASVIIPSHNRNTLVQRAYDSVISQKGANFVEVIIVDDFSEPPLKIQGLRSQDKIIRLTQNQGGAVARNVGLNNAIGRLIYFLDSDDYFVERDFKKDSEFIGDSDDLFYCSSTAGGLKLKSPNFVDSKNYFNNILYQYPGVANTCSMVFKNKDDLRFDERMPKHQDWDFVFFNFIIKGRMLVKIEGTINIDRSDRNSTSRIRNYRRSLVWLDKVKACVDTDTYDMIEYHVLADYTDYMSWIIFFKRSLYLFFTKKNTLFVIFKKTVQRILL